MANTMTPDAYAVPYAVRASYRSGVRTRTAYTKRTRTQSVRAYKCVHGYEGGSKVVQKF
jgi:hypothetical protein